MSLVIGFVILTLVIAGALVLSRDADYSGGNYSESRIGELDGEFADHPVVDRTPAANNSSIIVPSNYVR